MKLSLARAFFFAQRVEHRLVNSQDEKVPAVQALVSTFEQSNDQTNGIMCGYMSIRLGFLNLFSFQNMSFNQNTTQNPSPESSTWHRHGHSRKKTQFVPMPSQGSQGQKLEGRAVM